MNKQIKWRIAQLNNGEVPNGYKKTDFGIFPCDWVTDKTLKDIGVFGKGKGIPGEKIQSEGVPCVGYGDIYMKFNNFHFDKVKSFVDEETANESQPIEKGTLLFKGTGETAEEIGKCVCYTGDEVIYAGGDIITFVSKQVNPLFLAYQQYQSYSLKKKASFGQGHSVVHIQKENLEKLNVAYPPSKEEQSRIVGILMKWDEALALYDKQIELLNLYKSICLRKMFPSKGVGGAEYPYVLVGMIEAWGGEIVDYPERRHCCGFGFRQYFIKGNRGYSLSNTHKKFESMEPFKPDLIITNCPGCPYFLDRWQYVIAESTGKTYGQDGHGIPALTYEEVAGLVMGYDPWDLGLQTHQVGVEPLLDKMGVEYDPAKKYLGKGCKDLGMPFPCSCLK